MSKKFEFSCRGRLQATAEALFAVLRHVTSTSMSKPAQQKAGMRFLNYSEHPGQPGAGKSLARFSQLTGTIFVTLTHLH